MTNRYKTAQEIEGTKRRMANYRKRLRDDYGLLQKNYWVTIAEGEKIKHIIKYWRAQENNLPPHQQLAASVLNPNKNTPPAPEE